MQLTKVFRQVLPRSFAIGLPVKKKVSRIIFRTDIHLQFLVHIVGPDMLLMMYTSAYCYVPGCQQPGHGGSTSCHSLVQADTDFIDALAHIRSGKCGVDQLQDLEAQCSSSLDISDGILPTVVCHSEPEEATRHESLPGL